MSQLISDEYREMQRQLHENPNYGVASVGFAPTVAGLIQKLGVTELLDYGAGKGRLGMALKERLAAPPVIHHYEPSRPDWAETPAPREFVTCIDVLEHIEPPLIDNVLDDLKRVTNCWGFFTIHTGPAVKVLPDGRNAHLIQEPPKWWLPKLMDRFSLVTFQRIDHGFWVLVEALEMKPLAKPAIERPVAPTTPVWRFT